MRELLFFALISGFLTACGGNATVSLNTNAANTTAINTTANTNITTTTVANANKPANANAAKPAETGPKRISFAKGTTESKETITLAPGASTQFVLGATGAQTLFITPESKDLTFKIVKGIAGELVKADDGSYSAETKGNNAANGDIVFEVKNPTKKELKTSIKVSIEDFAD